jgi:hypothetical protein
MTRGVFTASTAVTAAGHNAVTDPPRCRVYNSANISLTSGVVTAMTFDTETIDDGGMHSTSVNTSRITVPSDGAGWYSIGGCVRFAANTTGYREIKITLNGTLDLEIMRVPNSGATDDVRVSIHTEYPLAVGDYVELYATQNSGGALNALGGFAYSPMMYAKWQGVF